MSEVGAGLSLQAALERMLPDDVDVLVAPLDARAEFAYAEEAAYVAGAVDKRRIEFATGRRLAHELLARRGVAPAAVLRAENRAPIWPDGVVGSITHGRAWCAVAIASVDAFRSLGLDHEAGDPLRARVWRSVLLPVERARVEELPAEQQGRAAKLIFSAKECVYKAIAADLGEIIGFHEVELRFLPDDADPNDCAAAQAAPQLDGRVGRFTGTLVDPARAARVPDGLEGRYLLRDEGFFTALSRRA